jgi:hypothetical protein
MATQYISTEYEGLSSGALDAISRREEYIKAYNEQSNKEQNQLNALLTNCGIFATMQIFSMPIIGFLFYASKYIVQSTLESILSNLITFVSITFMLSFWANANMVVFITIKRMNYMGPTIPDNKHGDRQSNTTQLIIEESDLTPRKSILIQTACNICGTLLVLSFTIPFVIVMAILFYLKKYAVLTVKECTLNNNRAVYFLQNQMDEELTAFLADKRYEWEQLNLTKSQIKKKELLFVIASHWAKFMCWL